MNDPRDDMPPRATILYTAAKVTSGDRDKTYGEPVGTMQNIARLWSEYLTIRMGVEVCLTGEDVAHMNTLMKIARTVVRGPAHVDNYIDGSCYEAIAGECAMEERPNAST